MTKVTLSWLNGGKEFNLPQMSLSGRRAVNELSRKFITFRRAQEQARFLYLCEAIVATKRIMDSKGVADAKKAFDAALPGFIEKALVASDFTWPEDQFERNLNSWYESRVIGKLGAKDLQHAIELLRTEAKELNEELEKVSLEAEDAPIVFCLNEFYWRLMAGKVKEITGPDGPVKLSWSEGDKETTMKTLAGIVSFDDMAILRKAESLETFHAETKGTALSDDDFSPVTVESIEKKS